MEEEAAFTTLSFACQNGGEAFSLDLELNIEKIISAGKALDIGISAVIKLKNSERSYWALIHFGPQPDFHRRDSFIVIL
jgi:hypothetical protein